MNCSKTLQDPPQDTAKATPFQDHFKTIKYPDLDPGPVLVHNLMQDMATDLVPIPFSIRAKVRAKFNTKSGDRHGTEPDLAATRTCIRSAARKLAKPGVMFGITPGTRWYLAQSQPLSEPQAKGPAAWTKP